MTYRIKHQGIDTQRVRYYKGLWRAVYNLHREAASFYEKQPGQITEPFLPLDLRKEIEQTTQAWGNAITKSVILPRAWWLPRYTTAQDWARPVAHVADITVPRYDGFTRGLELTGRFDSIGYVHADLHHATPQSETGSQPAPENLTWVVRRDGLDIVSTGISSLTILDYTTIAPLNLLYALYYLRHRMPEETQQRLMEALAGWVAAGTRSTFFTTRPGGKGEPLDDELPAEVALSLHEMPAPKLPLSVTDDRFGRPLPISVYRNTIEAMGWIEEIQEWCRRFAKRTVVSLERELRDGPPSRNMTSWTELDENLAIEPLNLDDMALHNPDVASMVRDLAPRELRAIQLRLQGRMPRHIGEELNVATSTANTFLKRAKEKILLSGVVSPQTISRLKEQNRRLQAIRRESKKRREQVPDEVPDEEKMKRS